MFGPDGKPINIGAGQIIGGPKKLEDIEPFNDATIDALKDGALQLLQSGQPMEIPAAMPMGQIVQFARTMLFQRDRIRELEARVAELEKPPTQGDNGSLTQRLDLSHLNLGNGTLNLGDITGDTGE